MINNKLFYQQKILKKQFNSLRFKWRELQKELKELEEISVIAFNDFYSVLTQEINKQNLPNPFLLDPPAKEKKNNGIFDEEGIKEMYRYSVKATHPDKAQEKENKIEIFQNISKAKKEGELNKFFDEFKKISNEEITISTSYISKLEEEIKLTSKKLDNIIKSDHYIWFYSSEKQKKIYIKNIIINIKTNEQKNTKK